MITETDIEKLISRCFENYWNTRKSKKYNLGLVSKIAANDVWKVVMQDLPNKQSVGASIRKDDGASSLSTPTVLSTQNSNDR